MTEIGSQVQQREQRPDNWVSEVARDTSRGDTTAQRGEDHIVAEIFEVIGEHNAWCVEFGAADGKRGSNTWRLITEANWKAVHIEPKRDKQLHLHQQRDSFEALLEEHSDNPNVICLNEMVQVSGPKRLDALLGQTPLPKRFDLLSIDIDSEDYRVWESLREYQPRVVVIEHNKTIPIEVDFASSQGSSLRALTRLAKEKGYELVAATAINAFFVLRDEYPRFGISNNDPARIWPGHSAFRHTLWQLYDGTVVIQGNPKLRWTRGHDATLAGQLRRNKFLWLRDGQRTHFHEGMARLPQPVISGELRALWYTVVNMFKRL